MSVIYLDKTVPGYLDLYDELSLSHSVYILDPNQNPFWQIANTIGSLNNIRSVHIFSHGEPGVLKFSSGSISSANIVNSKDYLNSIGGLLGQGGDIHLYGCNVAQGNEGKKFLDLLSNLSKSDVTASDDVTGSSNLNADWDLEIISGGNIDSASLAPATFLGSLGTPSISNLDNPLSYTENAALAALDNDITVTGGAAGGDKYEGGWIEFSLTTATSTDFLRFTDDGSASTVNGQVSIVNSVIYVGNGTGAAILGNVDSTKTGLAGKALRVNISNKFQNGDFETNNGSNTFGNWQIYDSGPIIFGTTKIAGLNTPTDATFPTPTGWRVNLANPNYDALAGELSDKIPPKQGTYSGTANDDGGGEYSVKLKSTSVVIDNTGLRSDGSVRKSGYDIIRGPALYSDNTVFLRSGDKVSFDWKAAGGSDAYDVYGYIVNVADNSFVKILDETGSSASASTSWATETVTVSSEGSYKFVFVAGTYDFSGGYWAGAQLFVDNVTVTENIVPPTISDAMVQAIARKVKYESTSEDPAATKTLTVKATSINGSNGAEQTGTATSTINFTKTNDAPTITSGSSASVNENLVNTTVVYDANASDIDSSDTLTFSISGTDASSFNLDTDDGEVRLKTSADYENKSSYRFNITVTDNGAGTLSSSKAITLNINDLNDPPVISSVGTGSIAENAATSTVAYDAAASDPDSGDTITFSISGTDAALFTIDSNDGEVRLKSPANFEVKNSYSLNVTATDNGSTPASGSKAITINVTDQNDAPVAIDDTAITTINTAKNNIVVLDDDTDEDGDTLNIQSVTYSGTGTVTHNGTKINYTPPTGADTLTENITYVVTDGNGGTDSGLLSVSVVTPLIQGPSNPAGSATSAISKNENITAVTTLTANVAVTWSINSGLDGDKFNIDAGGNLTFKSNPNFEIPTDSDSNNTYQVEIKAVEGGGFFSTQILTVTVQNVNEAAPVIDTSNLTGSVKENVAISTVIYDVSASDADTTDVLTYSVSGTDSSLVTIDSDDGEVRLKASANFEAKNSYGFNVTVTDPDASNDTEAVTVNVTDANDAPVITSGSTATLAENVVNSTVFYTVTATDVDAGSNLTYSVSGADGYLVAIDSDDGQARLKTSADFESKASYNFNVVATDDGAGTLSGSKAVTLNISDVNDDPIVLNPGSTWNVYEDFTSKRNVSSIFSDPDDDLLTLSARSVGGGILPGWITFNSTSNELTVNPARSDSSGTNIEIEANDGNGGKTSNQFSINVVHINHPVTGVVNIEGTAIVGEKVVAKPSLNDVEGLGTLNFQWYREGVKIVGANTENYVLSGSDIGEKVTVEVSFVDGLGFPETISSASIEPSMPTKTLKGSVEGNRNVFKDAFSQVVIKGGVGDDVVVATGGNSAIEGGAGSDVIIGGTGDNPLSGNTENDFLIGDLLLSNYFLGDDTLEGGPGDDLIEGGNGADTFVFSPGDGNDTIAKFSVDLNNIIESKANGRDFEPGKDKLDLVSFGYKDFNEVLSKITNNNEGHAQFSDQDSNVLFYGVTIEEFSTGDFILI
ncbi:MAG: cadherin domain-containing protein [Paracoccaceae bacterium]|nr:cadherin domain-containing protein [Paracoccaceae bacterium]